MGARGVVVTEAPNSHARVDPVEFHINNSGLRDPDTFLATAHPDCRAHRTLWLQYASLIGARDARSLSCGWGRSCPSIR